MFVHPENTGFPNSWTMIARMLEKNGNADGLPQIFGFYHEAGRDYFKLFKGTAVFGWVMSGAGFKGEYDIQGIAQPATVETAIRFMYSWVPMIMCAVIFIIFVTSFNLDRDLKRLRAEKASKPDY